MAKTNRLARLRYRIVLPVLCAIAFLLGCRASEPRAVTIGAVLPLSGDAAKYGEGIRAGMDLAVSEANARGIGGGRILRVVYEDDRGQAETGRSSAQKLISLNKVPAIVGGAMSSVASAIGPLCQEREVVLLSPTASATSLRAIGDYFFRIAPSDELDGRLMADFAYNKLKLRHIAIMYVNLEYGKSIESVFRKDFTAKGGTIVADEAYSQGQTNFRAELTKIKAAAPDAIYLPGYYAELANLLKQARELGIRTQILSANGFFDPELLKIAGDTAEGAIFTVSAYDPGNSDESNRKFVSAFRHRYNRDPDFFAVQGYDAIGLTAAAIEHAGPTSKGIREYLASVKDYVGAGGVISFDSQGEVVKPLRLLTVKGNKFVPLER